MSTNGFTDWFFGAAYLTIAVLCVVACVRSGRQGPRSERVIWIVLAVVMVMMAWGRWIGAVGDLTIHMRRIARHDGWWRDRRRLQTPLAILMLVAWALVVAWVLKNRAIFHRQRRLIAVTCSLVMFAALRAISLHDIDSAMRYRLFGALAFGNVVELVLVVIGIDAAAEPALDEHPTASVS